MQIKTPTPAHIIVLGNEKGGSGKSTVAMHVAVGLLRLGFSVATIDLDSRQGTFSRYFYHRTKRAAQTGIDLPQPAHHAFKKSGYDARSEANMDEAWRLGEMIGKLKLNHDFIVMDSPGSDSFLAREAHSYADTLITPINDSFVDFVLLGTVDPQTKRVTRPSIYAEMVWEQRKRRQFRDGGNIDWLVLRNRLSTLNARNKQDMGEALDALADKIGFRTTGGLSERVIYRELFLHGLTMFDTLEDAGEDMPFSMSHIAARQEVRQLLDALCLPQILQRTAPVIANDDGAIHIPEAA
jgi:chromosome partitioning protein